MRSSHVTGNRSSSCCVCWNPRSDKPALAALLMPAESAVAAGGCALQTSRYCGMPYIVNWMLDFSSYGVIVESEPR